MSDAAGLDVGTSNSYEHWDCFATVESADLNAAVFSVVTFFFLLLTVFAVVKIVRFCRTKTAALNHHRSHNNYRYILMACLLLECIGRMYLNLVVAFECTSIKLSGFEDKSDTFSRYLRSICILLDYIAKNVVALFFADLSMSVTLRSYTRTKIAKRKMLMRVIWSLAIAFLCGTMIYLTALDLLWTRMGQILESVMYFGIGVLYLIISVFFAKSLSYMPLEADAKRKVLFRIGATLAVCIAAFFVRGIWVTLMWSCVSVRVYYFNHAVLFAPIGDLVVYIIPTFCILHFVARRPKGRNVASSTDFGITGKLLPLSING